MKRFRNRLYLADSDEHKAGSTNEYGVVLDRAIEFDVVERPKATQYVFGKHTWSTQKAIIESMKDDPRLFWEIRNLTMSEALEMVR